MCLHCETSGIFYLCTHQCIPKSMGKPTNAPSISSIQLNIFGPTTNPLKSKAYFPSPLTV